MRDTGRRVLVRGSGAACLIVGVVVTIIGQTPWQTRLRPLPGMPTTIAAIGIGLAGAALLSLVGGRRRLGGLLGALLAAIGLLDVVRHLAPDVGPPIDGALENLLLTVGELGSNTALALTMFGLGIAVAGFGRQRRLPVAGLLGLGVLTVSLVSLLGHGIGARAAYAWGHGQPMSVLTAVCLAVVGLALLLESTAQETPANMLTIWGLPLAAAILTVLVGVFFRGLLVDQHREQTAQEVAATSARVRAAVEAGFDRLVEGVASLTRHATARGWTAAADWRPGAELALGAMPGYRGLILSDLPGRDAETPDEDAAAGLTPPPRFPRLVEARARALEDGEVAVAAPLPLEDGSPGIAVIRPVIGVGGEIGTVTALFSAREMLQGLQRATAPGYRMAVEADDRVLYGDPDLAARVGDSSAAEPVGVPGPARWRIVVRPRGELLDARLGTLPDVLLFASLVIAVLVATTMRFGIEAERRAREFQRAVDERTVELEEAVQALERHNREHERDATLLQRLQEVALMLAGQLEAGRLVRTVVEAARQLTDVSWAAFFTPDALDEHPEVRPYATAGDEPELLAAVTDNPEILATTLREGRSVREDLRPVAALDEELRSPLSYLAVPVRGRDQEVSGALVLVDWRAGWIQARAEEIAQQLATHAALALDTAHLLEAEREARTVAQEASAAKDRFIRILGHELRNPLGSIRSALHVLDEDPADPRREQRMRGILRRQVRHITKLVDDLLDISRISEGRISLRPRPQELGKLLRERIETHRPAAEEAGLQLGSEIPEDEVWVDVDPTRIAQVVDNLLSNALRYTASGGRVDVGIEADAERVTFYVRDTGKGIEPEERERIFEPFTQAPEDTDSGGLGLGLSLVGGLVAAHGGEIEVDSAGRGRGAEFRVRLDRRDAPPSAVREETSVERGHGGRSVLLVEDHADAAASLGEILESRGHRVRIAHDGETGLAVFHDFDPHLVVCDINLPDIDGFEVVRRLRATDAGERARIVALTGYGDEDTLQRSREAGFDDHLLKPVDPRKLLDILGA